MSLPTYEEFRKAYYAEARSMEELFDALILSKNYSKMSHIFGIVRDKVSDDISILYLDLGKAHYRDISPNLFTFSEPKDVKLIIEIRNMITYLENFRDTLTGYIRRLNLLHISVYETIENIV